MKVTECLNTEHGVFLAQLRVLETMLKDNVSDEALRAAVRPIAETVERHRQAEEKILYPAIQKELGEDFPPIRAMEAEHEEIGRCIQAIASGQGSIPDQVRRFIDALRQHILKEIQVLFPVTEQAIAAPDLERMTKECVEYYHHAAGVVLPQPSGQRGQGS